MCNGSCAPIYTNLPYQSLVEVVILVWQVSEFTGRAVDVDVGGSKGREESFLPNSRDLREVEVAGTTVVIVAHSIPGRERKSGKWRESKLDIILSVLLV